MKKIREQKGISLIVLVITILVMIILAGVVVVSLQKNNPIEKAKTAKDTSNLSALKEELELYKTNELMLGNKDTNNISFTETEVKDILKNIPDNLKGKVVVSNGKLGVGYSKITEEARDYARENDIFNIEDKISPDAYVYVEEREGKKYVICDSIDYETDIAKIYNEETKKEIKPNLNYEKILIICDKSKNEVFTEFLKKQFKNVDLIESSKVDTSKYNVVVGYAAQFSCLLDNDMQDVYINRFKNANINNPTYLVTGGNDTVFRNDETHIFDSCIANVKDVKFVLNTSINDLVEKKLAETKQFPSYYTDDTRVAIKFKDNSKITKYLSNTAFPSHPDSIGMYLDKTNKKGWFHMQECGDWDIPGEVELSAKIYKAAITKMTGSRSMEIDVTGVAPGTKYSFTVTDLAGNKVIKEITL